MIFTLEVYMYSENDYTNTDFNFDSSNQDVETNTSSTAEGIGIIGGCLLVVWTFIGTCFAKMPLLALTILTSILPIAYAVTAIISLVVSIIIFPLAGLIPFVCFAVIEIFLSIVILIMCGVTLVKAINTLKQNKRYLQDYKRSKTIHAIIAIIMSGVGLLIVLPIFFVVLILSLIFAII